MSEHWKRATGLSPVFLHGGSAARALLRPSTPTRTATRICNTSTVTCFPTPDVLQDVRDIVRRAYFASAPLSAYFSLRFRRVRCVVAAPQDDAGLAVRPPARNNRSADSVRREALACGVVAWRSSGMRTRRRNTPRASYRAAGSAFRWSAPPSSLLSATTERSDPQSTIATR